MKYYYIFGDNYGWSEEFNFTAAPEQGFSGTIRLIAYGGQLFSLVLAICLHWCVNCMCTAFSADKLYNFNHAC